MARVRGVIAARTRSASSISVWSSTSTKIGVAPTRDTQPAVAKKENVGVITSSPGPTPSAISATSSASVPDETAMAKRAPIALASSASSPSTSGPIMKCCESQTRVIAARTSARIVAYCC
jgi:hypothetical protein